MLRRKEFLLIFLLAAGALVFPASSQQQLATPDASKGETKPIRVMSFNIRYGTANDGDNHWKLRHELVVKTIKDESPDLLGTQETLKFQAAYLQKKLEGYESFGRTREKDPDKGEQCTIFFRKGRFKKVDGGQFWLSESPDQIGSKSWDSSLPRIATWVIVADQSNDGRKLLFLNTHFDHRGPKARHESAKLIRSWLEKNHRGLPVIVTGDFNCGEDSKPYNAMTKKSDSIEWVLNDTYREMKPKTGKSEGTFNGFRGTRSGARIDWVLQRGMKTTGAGIITANDKGRYPSDHFPVSAKFEWIGK